MNQKNKPLFITFEGGEGSGKSTLIKSIFDAFNEKEFKVFRTREPGGTDLGEQVRTLLLHQKETPIGAVSELLLFLASRAQHIEELIGPHLAKGSIVLCDRFNESTIAYQGIARGVGFERTRKLCELACGNIKPDLTFILDLDPQKGMERINKMDKEWDRLEELKLSFHKKVQKGYHQLEEKEPERIHLIDATKSKEQVFQSVWEIIESKLK